MHFKTKCALILVITLSLFTLLCTSGWAVTTFTEIAVTAPVVTKWVSIGTGVVTLASILANLFSPATLIGRIVWFVALNIKLTPR